MTWEEKRKHPRKKISTPADFVLNDKKESFELLDISQGGVSFQSDKFIDTGSTLSLDLDNCAKFDMVVLDNRLEAEVSKSLKKLHKIRCQFEHEMEDSMWDSIKDFF